MASTRGISPLNLVLVMAGGAVGAAARAAITLPFDGVHPLAVPGATLAANLIGAFLLGVLVAWIGDRRPRLKLFVGTGLLGGFTTYSAFAVHVVTTGTAAPLVGIALLLLSLAGGVIAAGAGLRLGHRTTAGEAP